MYPAVMEKDFVEEEGDRTTDAKASISKNEAILPTAPTGNEERSIPDSTSDHDTSIGPKGLSTGKKTGSSDGDDEREEGLEERDTGSSDGKELLFFVLRTSQTDSIYAPLLGLGSISTDSGQLMCYLVWPDHTAH